MKNRKYKEYEMKIIKMAGHLSDYAIDRAIETDDYSNISGFLIDYFSGPVGKPFDVGYLYSKYKEYELNEKIEDVDFDVDEWYKLKYESSVELEREMINKLSDEEYTKYMIEKRKKEL